MKLHRVTIGKAIAGIAALFIPYAPSADAAGLEGRWIQHPSATLRSHAKEGQVDRILEGNTYVYFSVRGAYIDRRGTGNYNVTYTSLNSLDPLQLFRYDKSLPWSDANIEPVAGTTELSGSVVDVINYSPELGVLGVVYDNNCVDFIRDSGDVVSSGALKDLAIPRVSAVPYNITFDLERPLAYVACNFGYVAINTDSGEIEEFVTTDRPLSWAGRVGDSMVLFAGSFKMPALDGSWTPSSYATDTYVYPAPSVPAALSHPVAGAGNLQALMPLPEGRFAALAPGASPASAVLKVFETTAGSAAPTAAPIPVSFDAAAYDIYGARSRRYAPRTLPLPCISIMPTTTPNTACSSGRWAPPKPPANPI